MAASTDQLHMHAIEAEKHAEQLATGLAQVGADDAAVKAVTQCAHLLRQVAVGLAKGGTADEPAPEAAPADAGPPKQTMGQAVDNHDFGRRP